MADYDDDFGGEAPDMQLAPDTPTKKEPDPNDDDYDPGFHPKPRGGYGSDEDADPDFHLRPRSGYDIDPGFHDGANPSAPTKAQDFSPGPAAPLQPQRPFDQTASITLARLQAGSGSADSELAKGNITEQQHQEIQGRILKQMAPLLQRQQVTQAQQQQQQMQQQQAGLMHQSATMEGVRKVHAQALAQSYPGETTVLTHPETGEKVLMAPDAKGNMAPVNFPRHEAESAAKAKEEMGMMEDYFPLYHPATPGEAASPDNFPLGEDAPPGDLPPSLGPASGNEGALDAHGTRGEEATPDGQAALDAHGTRGESEGGNVTTPAGTPEARKGNWTHVYNGNKLTSTYFFPKPTDAEASRPPPPGATLAQMKLWRAQTTGTGITMEDHSQALRDEDARSRRRAGPQGGTPPAGPRLDANGLPALTLSPQEHAGIRKEIASMLGPRPPGPRGVMTRAQAQIAQRQRQSWDKQFNTLYLDRLKEERADRRTRYSTAVADKKKDATDAARQESADTKEFNRDRHTIYTRNMKDIHDRYRELEGKLDKEWHAKNKDQPIHPNKYESLPEDIRDKRNWHGMAMEQTQKELEMLHPHRFPPKPAAPAPPYVPSGPPAPTPGQSAAAKMLTDAQGRVPENQAKNEEKKAEKAKEPLPTTNSLFGGGPGIM